MPAIGHRPVQYAQARGPFWRAILGAVAPDPAVFPGRLPLKHLLEEVGRHGAHAPS
jgi:hypothetical protein